MYVEELRVVGGDWGVQRVSPCSAVLGHRRRHAYRPLLQLKDCNENHRGVNESAIILAVL